MKADVGKLLPPQLAAQLQASRLPRHGSADYCIILGSQAPYGFSNHELSGFDVSVLLAGLSHDASQALLQCSVCVSPCHNAIH